MVENVRRLFESLELDPNLVDGIIDWIDENDEEAPFGAESSYYESLDMPVRCKNGPLDSIEELLLIKDFDEGMLYGEEDVPGLAEFVTVCGDDEGFININSASEEVIAAVLNSESLASMIVDMRESSPFANAADMATRLPETKLTDKFTPWSSVFLVSSTGRVLSGDSPAREVKITTIVKRVQSEEELESGHFRIDTAFWKVER